MKKVNEVIKIINEMDIKDEDKFLMQEVDNAFNFIPDETNKSILYTKDTTPISVGVKPVKVTKNVTE